LHAIIAIGEDRAVDEFFYASFRDTDTIEEEPVNMCVSISDSALTLLTYSHSDASHLLLCQFWS